MLNLPSWAIAQLDKPQPGDDATYRPTVAIRKGPALGTGVIIASVEGETLILTAAHVVEGPGLLHVELFRYNLGWEKSRSVGRFPRRVAAAVAARDRDTDLAILRVTGELAFPFVARIAAAQQSLAPGTAVTSIGFDHGERLIGFSTQVRRIDRVDMDHGGGERPFLVTENPPEVGRSGGGLFLADGSLAGVCIARAQLPSAPIRGLYSTVGNVRRLLGSHEDLASVVERSHPVTAVVPSVRPKGTGTSPQINRTSDRIRSN